jgi:hypothetical protein
MTATTRLSWLLLVILAGASYGFIGIVFALPSNHARAWRLAAWGASGLVYAAHIGYEQYRLGNSVVVTAMRVAMAVALGAFLLAVGATVHSALVPSQVPQWRFLIALIIWPVITAVPALWLRLRPLPW